MSFLDAREHGSKPGSGFLSLTHENVDRRERLRRLALETIDLEKDPYLMKNHIGQYECRLCLTLHQNEGSYLAHTQGKRHQQNMAKRAVREATERAYLPIHKRALIRKNVLIGRPGYRVTKQFDTNTTQRSLLFQIDYPEIEQGCRPRHRIMSAYEQRKESTDKKYQYVLFHAVPYEIIAFKVPSYEVDRSDSRTSSGIRAEQDETSGLPHKDKFFVHWDLDNKIYTLQLHFKNPRENR